MDDNIIPHALRVMMDQLFTNNSLKSWGVFPNQYGQLCLNIRFDICEVGQSSKPVTTCAFRRVSDKQLARNATRSMHNKKRKLNPPTPETKDTHISPSSPIIHTSPELPRMGDISLTADNVFTQTPETVSWINQTPESHSITVESPYMPSLPSPSESSYKTFVPAFTQTDSDDDEFVDASVKIDTSECLIKTNALPKNEQFIESPVLSKCLESLVKKSKSLPKPKPTDCKPNESYIKTQKKSP